MSLDKKKFNIILGAKIRLLRENINFSQEKLAAESSLSRNYIGEIERGEKSISTYNLFLILTVLKCSKKTFFQEVEEEING